MAAGGHINEEQLIETLSGLVDHRLKPGVDDNARFLFCMHLNPDS
jgi:hypothetical protein